MDRHSTELFVFSILSILLMAALLGMLWAWVWASGRIWKGLPIVADDRAWPLKPAPWGSLTVLSLVFLYLGVNHDCLSHLRRGHGPAASASRQSGREPGPGRRPGARQGDRQVEERRESTITGGSLRGRAEQGREVRTARSGPRRFDGTIASRADVSICREQWPVARARSSIRAVDVGSGPGGPWPASAGVAAADGNRRAGGDADDATRLRDSVSHSPDLAIPRRTPWNRWFSRSSRWGWRFWLCSPRWCWRR